MTAKQLKANKIGPTSGQLNLFSPEAGVLSAPALRERFNPMRRTEAELGEHNRGAALLQQYFMKEHHAYRHHFDFRLGMNGILASWAIPDGPSYCPAHRRRAIQVGNHLKKNVGFEGVFPDGKPGAGPTMLWDRGFWEPLLECSNVKDCLRRGHLRFTIYGKKLMGNWRLTWAEGTRRSEYGSVWYLTKDHDSYARDESAAKITMTSPWSVRSGMTLQQVKASFLAGGMKRPPQRVTLFEL